MDLNTIIIKPLLTEKSNLLRESAKKSYVFVVDARANKIQIEAAVRKLFSVTPLSTRVVNVKGKAKSMGRKKGRVEGKTSSYKKAYITLPENQKIEKFEGV
ncbi:MAG: 50S ribosomal protein L23 [Spirochaetes bacterium GWB1_48_6]|nr:MAG: 50S ribosomal protein L23 [Spirochaetes bacterium GWB1_48_6]